MRMLPLLFLLLAPPAIVAQAPKAPPNCLLHPSAGLTTTKERIAVEETIRLGRTAEIVSHFPAPPEKTAQLVMDLMVRCGMPVTNNTSSLVEAKYPREMGLMGHYDLIVHAFIARDDSGSIIRLRAEETSYSGSALNPDIYTHPVDNRNHGRSQAAWYSLIAVQRAVESDSVRSANTAAAIVSGVAFIGSLSKKLFMAKDCELAKSIAGDDKVVFSTEAEAKAAGYARSGADGC